MQHKTMSLLYCVKYNRCTVTEKAKTMPKDKFLTKLTNRTAKAMETTGNAANDRYFIYIQICCHFYTFAKPNTQYLQKHLFL